MRIRSGLLVGGIAVLSLVACDAQLPATEPTESPGANEPTATPEGTPSGNETLVPPTVDAQQNEYRPGDTVPLVGQGGYVRGADGLYDESSRDFVAYFDGAEAGSVNCYANRCEGEVVIPADVQPGVHTITVEHAEPITVSVEASVQAGDIESLLSVEEVVELAGVPLVVTELDQLSAAGGVDPTQVEQVELFKSLSFSSQGGNRDLIITLVDFASESAASEYADTVTGRMLDLPEPIGDVSAYQTINMGGVGSIIVFRVDERIVTLHTAQPDGTPPLVDIDGLGTLAQTLAGRLQVPS